MIELARLVATDQEVAEVEVAENGTEGLEALFMQLFTVGDEEKPRILACRRMLLTSPAAIVERRDHRLSSAGSGHDQVTVTPLNSMFGIEPVENLLLERVGP